MERTDQSPGDFDIIFNYGQIQWETGDASGGTGGLGGNSARAGYSNGSEAALELPGSGVPGSFLDSSPSGLVHGSRASSIAGRYVFEVRSGTAPVGGAIRGSVFGESASGTTVDALAGATVQFCLTGGGCITEQTDDLGRYDFTGLSPGEYAGEARPPISRPDLQPAAFGPSSLLEGGALDVDFVLRRSEPMPSPTATPPGGASPTPTRTRTPVPPTPTPPGAAEGDSDCSGNVNSIDAAVILQFAVQLITAVPCPLAGDVNEDGRIDAIDAALILQYIVGLVEQL